LFSQLSSYKCEEEEEEEEEEANYE